MSLLARLLARRPGARPTMAAPATIDAPVAVEAPSIPAEPPRTFFGTLLERSTRHVAGWAYDPERPGSRVTITVVLVTDGVARVVANGVADQFSRVLSMLNIGDAIHAFRIHFRETLSEADVGRLEVRLGGSMAVLQHDPKLRERWEPITHVALDIVDNCNLRCPFCLYDYEGVRTTNAMTTDAFRSALRLLPLVGPGHFWLSCFHEPTLHPRFLDLLELIPAEYRSNVFFTTNLAKRMPDSYFAALARSGLNHINISIESRDPAIYERMRKGARHRIFVENWDKLIKAFREADAPPSLRYIIMAYRSNVAEIPDLVRYLREERLAWSIEVRDTYIVPHLPAEFRDAEFLDMDQWRSLHRALSIYRVQDVMMSLPPGFTQAPVDGPVARTHETGVAVPDIAQVSTLADPDRIAKARAAPVPGLCEIKMSWTGEATILPALAGDYPSERSDAVHVNIAEIDDPPSYFLSLLAGGEDATPEATQAVSAA